MSRPLVVALVGGVAALVVLVVPAYAAQNGSITVSPSTVPAGGTVHISGSVSVKACPLLDSATVVGKAALFPPDGFGPSAARNAQGDFALDHAVPTSTPPGSYEIEVRCGGGNVGIAATLTVSAGPLGGPATGGGGTAHGSSTPWAIFGAGCLLLAGLLVALRRRVRRTP
jgi:hypothetical protein